MNHVIITNISRLNPKSSENSYTSYDNKIISGKNTNDAPVKYLLTCLKEQNAETPVRILAVTTQEAEPACLAFEQTLQKFSAENNLIMPELVKISTKDTEIAQTIKNIISQIHRDDKVYIDTTGGFRNSSYLLMAVVRILEYSGISLEKAVYSNLFTFRIEDVTSTYQMFNLINAAELFTSLGNSEGLQTFFEEKKSTEIKKVIHAMNQFSEAVALCRTSGLDDILQELNSSLIALDDMTPTTENEILFQSISGVIREKFGIHEKEDHQKIDYVDMIRWCLDNKQIQQAVTIYTEKIGTYLYGTYYKVSPEIWDKFNQENSRFDIFYRIFHEGLMNLCGITPIGTFLKSAVQDTRICNALKSCKDITQFQSDLPYLTLEKPVLEGLKNFFRVKRFLYAEDGSRRDESVIQKKFEEYPQFAEFQNLKAKNITGFLSQISTTRLTSLLQVSYISSFENIKFNTIESLPSVIAAQKNYTLLVPAKQMQEIMRDYLYIKNCLRNVLNHASDQQEIPEEDQNYYAAHGYPVYDSSDPSSALTLKEIIRVLETALAHLKL